MNLTLDTSVLNGKVLIPLNKLVDDCILTITPNSLESIATVASRAIIVYIKYDVICDVDGSCNLNIQDISKLSSVLNCIKNQTVDMTVENNNCIKYKSDAFKFKFGLTEDGVIPKPKIKKTKLENINYQTSTKLDVNVFREMLKASAFIKSDDVKLYFYTMNTEDSIGLYCDITNKSIPNADSITLKLSDSCDGLDMHKELICNIEYIRKMHIQKDSDIYVYFNTDTGFTIFDLIDEHGRIRYILPTLSK
jgi:hypothetical protein